MGIDKIPNLGESRYPPPIAMARPKMLNTTGIIVFFVA